MNLTIGNNTIDIPQEKQDTVSTILAQYFGGFRGTIFELPVGAERVTVDGRLLGELHPSKIKDLKGEIAILLTFGESKYN